MLNAKLAINTVITVSILGLSACGGGSKKGFGTPVILEGVFKDSNVSGLYAVSGEEEGITDKDGKFTYEEGQLVTFSIGAVKIGSGVGKPVMTPIDLVKNGKLASPEVINKARFLMALDKDNTPSNGIEISKKVQLKAKDWEAVDFKDGVFPSEAVHTIIGDASVEDGINHAPLPDKETALKHLKTTLFCANAGAFVGTYSGDKTGNIALVVDPVTGAVKGSSYDPENEVSVEVKSTAVLDYDKGLKFIAMEDSAKIFTGSLTSVDKIEGTWIDSAGAANTAEKGTFIAKRIGGKSSATYRYSTAYTGDEMGLYAFDVDDKNNVTGTTYNIVKNEKLTLSGKITKNDKGINLLTVTTTDKDDDTKINGKISEELVVEGFWSNLKLLANGDFDGGGCKLN